MNDFGRVAVVLLNFTDKACTIELERLPSTLYKNALTGKPVEQLSSGVFSFDLDAYGYAIVTEG